MVKIIHVTSAFDVNFVNLFYKRNLVRPLLQCRLSNFVITFVYIKNTFVWMYVCECVWKVAGNVTEFSIQYVFCWVAKK